ALSAASASAISGGTSARGGGGAVSATVTVAGGNAATGPAPEAAGAETQEASAKLAPEAKTALRRQRKDRFMVRPDPVSDSIPRPRGLLADDPLRCPLALPQ